MGVPKSFTVVLSTIMDLLAVGSKAFTVIDDVEGASSLTHGFEIVAILFLTLVVDRINL